MQKMFSKSSRTLPVTARQAVALALCGLTGLAASAVDPSTAVEGGYRQALAANASPRGSSTPGAPEAGSEAYWLGQSYAAPAVAKGGAAEGKVQRALFENGFAKGKQIVTGEGANARVLEIVNISHVDPATTRLVSGPAENRFLITGRDTTDGTTHEVTIDLGTAATDQAGRSL